MRRGGWAGEATFEWSVERDGEEVPLTVKASGYYVPANWNEPADGEIEVLSVTGPGGEDWSRKLTTDEDDQLNTEAGEQVHQAAHDRAEEP